jgi:hypothetical protein
VASSSRIDVCCPPKTPLIEKRWQVDGCVRERLTMKSGGRTGQPDRDPCASATCRRISADAWQAMKARLDEARSESALFDTTGFARDLESLHGRIRDEHCTGRQEIIGPVG